MNATEYQLLLNDAEEALAAMTPDFSWWHLFLMGTGAVFWVSAFVAGFLYLVTEDEPEIHPSIECLCLNNGGLHVKCPFHGRNTNHSNALTFADFKREINT